MNSAISGWVVGLEAITSVSSALNVAGSSSKVLLPSRSVTGSSLSPAAKLACWSPIALKVVLAFSIRSDELRRARADRGDRLRRFDEEVREHRLVAHELGEEVVRGAQEGPEVFGRFAELLAGADVLLRRCPG